MCTLPVSQLPGSTIVEQLEREIEEGEFTSFRLEELPSKEEVTEANETKRDQLGVPVTMTLTGAMLRRQVRVKVEPPALSEAFRKRIDILWADTAMANLKQTRHPLFEISDGKVLGGHVRYILGPTLKDLESKHLSGAAAKTQVGIWYYIITKRSPRM